MTVIELNAHLLDQSPLIYTTSTTTKHPSRR